MIDKKIKTIFIVTAIVIFVAFALLTQINGQNGYVEATKELIEEFNVTNEITKNNKISSYNVESSEMAKRYYNDYKFMIINYQDEAFEMISDNSITKDEYLNLREKIINDYYSYNYSSYTSYQDKENKCYVYRVTDSKGNIFTFKVYAVMKYEVNIRL